MRLNQAATNALMARLEAQKAICDASEKELHKKYKIRDELEKQIRPEWEARKRSRMDDTIDEERGQKTVLYLPAIRPKTPLHKELRVFLEEEHKASEAGLSLSEEERRVEVGNEMNRHPKDFVSDNLGEHDGSIAALEDENLIEHKLRTLEIGDERKHSCKFPAIREPEIEEDEESRKERGKGNVEKWLQMLLENTSQEEFESQNEIEDEPNMKDDIIRKLNMKYPQKEVKNLKFPESDGIEASKTQTEKSNVHEGSNVIEGVESSKSFEGRERRDHNGKERKLVRSESARAFRRIPSSPSLILGMKKGVDCIGKKPMVDDDDEDHVLGNSFIKSSIKTIKKAVKI